jgi:hypothetical protein
MDNELVLKINTDNTYVYIQHYFLQVQSAV